jgi:hypothetical protein
MLFIWFKYIEILIIILIQVGIIQEDLSYKYHYFGYFDKKTLIYQKFINDDLDNWSADDP